MSKDALKFAREVKQEALKVTWPTRKEVITTTIVVFIMIAIVSVFLLTADWLIAGAVKFILGTGN